jgi:hypothetical protein
MSWRERGRTITVCRSPPTENPANADSSRTLIELREDPQSAPAPSYNVWLGNDTQLIQGTLHGQ